MVRVGSDVQAMADFVCTKLELPANSFVPVFSYLKRAFWVPLNFLLPLQAGFDEPYAQVALVGFRFSEEFLGRLGDVTAWTWDHFRQRIPNFDVADLHYQVNEFEIRQIAFCVSKSVPRSLSEYSGLWERTINFDLVLMGQSQKIASFAPRSGRKK